MRIFLCSVAALALGTISVPAVGQSMGTMKMPKCSASNPIVWANASSKIFYLKGQQNFGTTKSGMYECRSTAMKHGYRPGKSAMMGGSSTMKGMGSGSMGSGSMGSGSMGGGSMDGGSMGGGTGSGGSTSGSPKPSGGAMSGGADTTTKGSAPAAGSGNPSPAPVPKST